MKQLLMIVCMAVSGCLQAQIGKKVNGGATPGLEGTWTYAGGGNTLTLVLYAGGTGEFDGAAINYTAANGKLAIITGNNTTTYSYQLTGNNLKLSGGDLDKPITFSKPGGANTPPPATAKTPANGSNSILGAWTSNDIELDFKRGDDVSFNGNPFKYTISGKELLIYNPAVANGKIYFTYEFDNGNLVLHMKGGETNVFERKISEGAAVPVNGSGDNSLLGTWAGQGIEFNFTDSRNLIFNGKKYTYTASNGTLTCTATGGSISYQYEINAGHLMLNYNGTTLMLAKKNGSGKPAAGNNATGAVKPANRGGSGLIDSWVSANAQATLMNNGTAVINGETVTFSYTANTISFQGMQGAITVNYILSGDKLSVTSNGTTEVYYRKGSAAARNGGSQTGGAVAGGIDPSMVGKWQRMGGGTSGGGSYSYEEYFVLYANGTYEYYNESGRNVSGNNQYGNEVFNGGTASQGADKGTWSVRGNIIYANSNSRGPQQYSFYKKNNKYGDPCIVLDGTEYVTTTKRAPW